jgi:hypothetical protein
MPGQGSSWQKSMQTGPALTDVMLMRFLQTLTNAGLHLQYVVDSDAAFDHLQHAKVPVCSSIVHWTPAVLVLC